MEDFDIRDKVEIVRPLVEQLRIQCTELGIPLTVTMGASRENGLGGTVQTNNFGAIPRDRFLYAVIAADVAGEGNPAKLLEFIAECSAK